MNRLTTVLFVLAIGFLAATNIACIGCTNISPGHVGVEIHKCSGGGVVEQLLDVGYHWYGLCTDVEEYPTFQQTLVLTKVVTEGSTNNDEITVTSSEGLAVSADVALNFTLEAGKVPAIYKKYRKDLDHIETTYMKQTIREGLQETFAKYTAQQLYSDKKEIARAEVQGILVKKFSPDGFNVTQFTINATRVPQAVTEAINSKVAMTQNAQKAEQEVKKIEAEANQTVAKAAGVAKAKRLQADADAYYNEVVSRSLTPQYVQWVTAKQWDGKLGAFSGGHDINAFVNTGK